MLAIALALTVGGAEAADDALEEVIVYGDDFARWDHTRWLVQSELILPMGAVFASDTNQSFVSHAFQVRAVIGCEKDAKLSKKKWEVSCEIEDIGILASSYRRWKREKDRELVQNVLDEIDAKLTGLEVQMQVDVKGGITNFDLEGLRTDNQRERLIQESLRQVTSRVMAGFHLRIPDHAQRGGQFIEYNSELMDLPSLTASRGSTTLVHVVSMYKGDPLVQTIGEGTVSVNLPGSSTDPFSTSNLSDGGTVDLGGDGGGIGAASGVEAAGPADGIARSESDVELTYSMSATGVALFEKDDGIMTERVWACHGVPTAGSGGGSVFTGAPFRNVGRIRMLAEQEKPDVGPTRQIALPGQEIAGLPSWVDIDSEPPR